MTHPFPLILLLFVISVEEASAQAYLMNGSPITDCSGTFYDSGGQTGNYSDNQNLATTICSDGATGTHVQLNFSGTDLAPGDEICFYDGPNAAAPLLSCSGDYLPGSPFIVQATAVNPSGCLTVTFNSDATGTASGWSAVLSCVPSCQTVLADLVSTNPAALPADTGWIDVCPGERIFFNGAGIYPQNGFAYPQSDLTTTFEWNFGDGDISYGPNTSHRYDQPGGYYVQLFLVDTQGCRSTNLINQRVRVAPRPAFSLTGALDNTICAGDTVHLSAGFDSSATDKTLLVLPVPSTFAVEGSRSDSLALPDGTGIPYQTSIFFSEFSPGQVLANPDDLESICVNMEHSWMRDIEISIACPNGQSIILHNFGGQTGSEVFLGIPNDNDFFTPIPGTGFDYCWTPAATNPTWLQYANTTLPGGGGTLPPGDYSPYEPFSDLVGCPLNGEWTITVTDLWPIDNGFIFSWSVKFKDALYPDIESFTPQFTSWNWNNHPSIFFSTSDSIAAAPQNGGTAGYIFTVNDEFGCSWDTLISFSVLPFTHPQCYRCAVDYLALRDTSVCAFEPVTLDAATLGQDTFEVRFEAYPDYRFGNGNHPHNNPYASPVAVNSLGYNILYNPVAQITSVCMDIETDFDADLNIYLRSPDGKQMELSTGNGAAGDNYKITCFSPSATIPIIGNAAPFNGTFKPEGSWTSLNNAAVNGNWGLVVSDGFGLNQYGKVKWWSIGFNFFDYTTYNWSNNQSLSCNNCPNPTATPSQTTTYIVAATNTFNCQHFDTVTVQIADLFPAPSGLEVVNMNGDAMTWAWSDVQGASGYEVSVNGGVWEPANGALSHTVIGLVPGDTVSIEVRALGGSANCPPAIASGAHVFVACNFTAMLTSTQSAVCAGAATGSAFISVSGAVPPVAFFPDGMMPGVDNGNLVSLFAAGNHFVIIRDDTGCRDTVYFNIAEPPVIVLNTSFSNAICNGDPTGAASATASGGTGNISFAWQGCAGGTASNGPAINDLYAGCYAVTATDANGCTAADSVYISEPPPFVFSSTQDSVSCHGGADGSATIVVGGGTEPYTYVWAGGGSTATVGGLAAGFYTVNVIDSALCEAATFVQVLEPPPLIADSTSTKAVSCFGGDNGTATVFVHGGVPPYSYLWDDMQNTQKALNLSAGTYSVTVTDAKGCTVVTQATVSAPPELTFVFTNIVHEKCAGYCNGSATVQVSGGAMPYSYTWDTSPAPLNTATATDLCPGAYMATVEDFWGCTQTDKVTINAALPVDIHIDQTPPSCAGLQDGTITATITGGSQPYQILWSNGATGAAVQNLACGNYTLNLTDSAGCVVNDTIALPCPDSIKILSIAPQHVKCYGGNDGSITVQAAGGTGTLTYLWSDPNAQTDATAVNLQAGTYTVTVTDQSGCSVVASTTLNQPDPLSIQVLATDVTCFGGADGTASAEESGGTAPYTYTWNWLQNEKQISNLPAGDYMVTVLDANGCSATASAAVNQPATAITASVVQTRFACFGESNGQAVVTASGSNGAPFTFLWSNNQTGQTADTLPVGTYTITISDHKGCTALQTIDIQQLEAIDANVAFVPPTCFGYPDGQAAVNHVSGGLGMGDTSLYNYEWSVPGSPNSLIIDNLTGGQNYFLTITDFQGCSGVFAFFITQPPQIMAQTDIQNVSCSGFSNGSVTITGITGASLPATYTWSNNTTGPLIEDLAAGDYILTIQDAKGCLEIDTIPVPEPEPLSVTFEVDPLICSGDQNAAATAVVAGGTVEYQLTWSTGAAGAYIDNLGPGVYTLNITDANGCTLTDSVFIVRPDSINIQSEKTELECFGDADGLIRLLVSGGQLPYRYSINGGAFGGSSTFLGLSAGVYQFQVKDGNGCIATFTDSIAQPLPVSVSLGPDTTIVLGDSILISPEVSNAFGMLEYKWRSALLENFICADSPECSMIWVKPYQTNTYRVTVTDEKGCRGMADVTVNVLKPRGVYVPSGFSPNGDLNNDRLVVYGKSGQILQVLSFRVYDRWGELVYEDTNFEVNDDSRGWDGLFRGKNCDPGVFVWRVEVEYRDGYREALSGNVTLIR